jgi:hypothetical protein
MRAREISCESCRRCTRTRSAPLCLLRTALSTRFGLALGTRYSPSLMSCVLLLVSLVACIIVTDTDSGGSTVAFGASSPPHRFRPRVPETHPSRSCGFVMSFPSLLSLEPVAGLACDCDGGEFGNYGRFDSSRTGRAAGCLGCRAYSDTRVHTCALPSLPPALVPSALCGRQQCDCATERVTADLR